MVNLTGRHFLKEIDFTVDEWTGLLDLAAELKAAKRERREVKQLEGCNLALIFEKTSTRTRCAFEVAAHDQGATTTYLDPSGSQIGHKESVADTARVLGRMFDGIQYRGFGQEIVEELAEFAGVPVWNGLTDEWHPTQMLADQLTIREHSPKPLSEVAFAYLGDARFNMGNSYLISGALVGMDVRIIAPKDLQPSPEVIEQAYSIADLSGAQLTITDDIDAVKDADFVSTDVWVSMGEPKQVWAERVTALLPYQVNSELLARTGNPAVKFMHCLPAYHDRMTTIGEQLYTDFGLDGAEVTNEVFESDASIVFDEAENRMHTIKAVLVSTLAQG